MKKFLSILAVTVACVATIALTSAPTKAEAYTCYCTTYCSPCYYNGCVPICTQTCNCY